MKGAWLHQPSTYRIYVDLSILNGHYPQAWSKFAAQKGKASLQAWLQTAPLSEVQGVLLQHIVPAYLLGTKSVL
jgi:hypothetical protein